MVLSKRAIESGINKGILEIDPIDFDDIEAAHVNLHLDDHENAVDGSLTIPAKGFTTASTRETIVLPDNLCALVEGRATLAQMGLSVEQSSKFVEPKTMGKLTLELFNASDEPIELIIGQKVAKLILMKVEEEL